jgi:hypothetical protein
LLCKKIDHRDGKSSEDQGDDSKVSFRLGERIELMGEDKKERWLKISRILFIIGKLGLKIISRIIERIDFIYPKGFSVKGVESQSKAYEEAKNKDKNFFSFWVTHNRQLI